MLCVMRKSAISRMPVRRDRPRLSVMTNKAGIVMIAGALTFAGCAAGAKSYGSGADLAKAAGCTGYAKDSEATMFSQESGTCQVDGKDVYLAIYADNKARDSADNLGKAAGASGYWAVGDRWDMQSDDKAAVEKAAKQAGGNLK